MMTAMMLPSVAPTVALYARTAGRHSPVLPLLFAAGYLLVWAAAGLLAPLVALAASALPGDPLAWETAGAPPRAARCWSPRRTS